MFTSGFFNSINSDRKYNAEQMAAIFDGLITDGIFDSIGDHFQVTPASSGLGVNIGTGRAWLNQTWSYNDTAYPVTLGAASSSLGRKDLICLKVDKSNAVRANSLVVIAGTPAESPVEPTVTDDTTNGIYYHKLAAVTVPKGATSISAANITNYIGLSSGTPYVTGILSSTTVDELWSQWGGEFNDWWDDIKATLDDNVVTTILNKIDHITPKEATMNLYGFSHINPPPSGKTYAEYSTDAILNQIRSLLNKSKVTKFVWSYTGTGPDYYSDKPEVTHDVRFPSVVNFPYVFVLHPIYIDTSSTVGASDQIIVAAPVSHFKRRTYHHEADRYTQETYAITVNNAVRILAETSRPDGYPIYSVTTYDSPKYSYNCIVISFG